MLNDTKPACPKQTLAWLRKMKEFWLSFLTLAALGGGTLSAAATVAKVSRKVAGLQGRIVSQMVKTDTGLYFSELTQRLKGTES